MINAILSRKFKYIMLKARKADQNDLRALRKRIMKAVSTFGAKQFVTVTADVLKENFQIEGCNDARVALKRIFDIHVEELEEELKKQQYDVPADHPLVMLSADHADNVKKLLALKASWGEANVRKGTAAELAKAGHEQVKGYYDELDLHIKKEEEILFPAVEENGMREHPDNLREEHQAFKATLSEILKTIDALTPSGREAAAEKLRRLIEKFVADMSNHIFRETFIFYPATLGFITEAEQWERISEAFALL